MTIFLETTIPSYLTARPSREWLLAAHQKLTRAWWENHRRAHELYTSQLEKLTRAWWENHRRAHELYTSQLVLDEAACGDSKFAARRLNVLADAALLAATRKSEAFTRDIVRSRILPAHADVAAAHIAIATAHEMDILLTWNCRHIANAANQHSLRRLADARALRLPIICTPEQLMEDTHENIEP